MGWLANAFVRESRLIKRLLKIVTYLTDSGGTITGFVDAQGNVITGLAAYSWADFTGGSFDLTLARHVVVTDKHSSISGTGGSLWYVDPTGASGSKRVCRSGGIVTTWANRPAVASYNGLEILVSDYNYSKYRSNGTNYLPVGRALLFSGIFGTFAAPTLSVNLTNSAQTFSWATQPKIPAGMGVTGSKFSVDATVYRNTNASTYAPLLTMFLGRNGTPSDFAVWAGTMTSTVDGAGNPRPNITLRSQQSILATYTATFGGSNLIAGGFRERNGDAAKLDFAYDQLLSLQLAATATTPASTETISIQTLQIWQDI